MVVKIKKKTNKCFIDNYQILLNTFHPPMYGIGQTHTITHISTYKGKTPVHTIVVGFSFGFNKT